MPQRLVPYNRDAQWFQERVRGYLSNLRTMIELAQSHKVPLLLVTGPSNVADWPPIYRDIAWAVSNPNYDVNIEKIRRLIQEGSLMEAEEETHQLLDQYGEDAMVIYLRATVYRLLGRESEARSLFLLAKDLDPYPWRVLSDFNDAIRSSSE